MRACAFSARHVSLGLALLLAGCLDTTATKNRLIRESSLLSDAVGAGGAGLITNNVGRLTGTLRGPAQGLIANNVGKLISNNVGKLISNNVGKLISNNVGKLDSSNPAGLRALLDAPTYAAVPGAKVGVFDEHGEQVSADLVTSGPDGTFSFDHLKPSGPLLFIRSSYQSEGEEITLASAVSAPTQAGEHPVRIDPQTTLLAKKLGQLVGAGALAPAAVTGDLVTQLTDTLTPAMTDEAVASAALLPEDAAADAFDRIVEAAPEVKAKVVQIAEQHGAQPIAKKAPPRKSGSWNTVTTFLGTGHPGSRLGSRRDAEVRFPTAVEVTPEGGLLVADSGNHRLLRVPPQGEIVLLAGAGTAGHRDGQGAAAAFDTPWGLATDRDGTLYVADSGNNCIRKVSPDGTVTTWAGGTKAGFADGPAATARFSRPHGLAVDEAGVLYVADSDNHAIRRIARDGAVTTLAGSGKPGNAEGRGAAAGLRSPFGVTLDPAGGVYVSDTGNDCIRRIDPDGNVTTLAGSVPGFADGVGAQASFRGPKDLKLDAGRDLIVADSGNNRLRKVTRLGDVSTLVGTGAAGFSNGLLASSKFWNPFGLALDAHGTLYVADYSNSMVRKVN